MHAPSALLHLSLLGQSMSYWQGRPMQYAVLLMHCSVDAVTREPVAAVHVVLAMDAGRALWIAERDQAQRTERRSEIAVARGQRPRRTGARPVVRIGRREAIEAPRRVAAAHRGCGHALPAYLLERGLPTARQRRAAGLPGGGKALRERECSPRDRAGRRRAVDGRRIVATDCHRPSANHHHHTQQRREQTSMQSGT